MEFDGIVLTLKGLKDYVIRQHVVRYVFASKYVRGMVVLDAACGSGYGTAHLAESGASYVIRVDLSRHMLSVARKVYAHPRVDYVCADCLTLPLRNGSFDIVISF